MSEVENNSKSLDGDESTYDKAKEYWQNVEPTICGMLGGIPEVGSIGETKFYKILGVSFHGDFSFRYPGLYEFLEASLQVQAGTWKNESLRLWSWNRESVEKSFDERIRESRSGRARREILQ
jgi:AdoMet dependent proline di-methyltransferase